MKVAKLLESRQANWAELESSCRRLESRRSTLRGNEIAHFAALYRAACTTWLWPTATSFPPARSSISTIWSAGLTIRCIAAVRSNGPLGGRIFQALPRRLFRDRALRLAFVVFWGLFLASAGWAYTSPRFAEQVLGKEMLLDLAKMYNDPIDGRGSDANSHMAGFYVWNNPSIGLQCFAAGLLFGVGGLFTTISNAALLGATTGYMATIEQAANFFHFVTRTAPSS